MHIPTSVGTGVDATSCARHSMIMPKLEEANIGDGTYIVRCLGPNGGLLWSALVDVVLGAEATFIEIPLSLPVSLIYHLIP